jgi:ribonuclease HI
MIVYTDGGCNKNGTFGSFRIEDNDGTLFELIRLENFDLWTVPVTTNNEAEYATMIEALRYCWVKKLIVDVVYTDSLLIVEHLAGRYKVRAENLQYFVDRVKMELGFHYGAEIRHVPREVSVEKLGH